MGVIVSGSLAADIPPVHFWGELGYDFRHETFEEGEDRIEHIGRLRLNGSTYLWQPWIARLDGGIGINLREEDRDSGSQSGTFLTGDTLLRLFPQSRFPFEAFFEKSETDVDGTITSLNVETTRYGLRQQYLAKNGASMHFDYEHIDRLQSFDTDPGRDTTNDIWQFGINKNLKNHKLALDSNLNFTEQEDINLETRRLFVLGRHQYRPGNVLYVDNMLTFNETDFEQPPTLDRLSSILQINQLTFWRPETRRPLLVTSNLRLREFNTDSAGDETETQSFSYDIGADYQLTPRWNFSGEAGYFGIDDQNDTRDRHFQRLAARYTSENIQFGTLDYNWTGLTAIRNSVGENGTLNEDEGAVQEAEIELGHSLRKRNLFGKRINFNFNQSANAFEDTVGRSTQFLRHNLSLSWSRSRQNSNTFASLSASDNRGFGGGGRFGDEDNEFQIVNFQLSRTQSLSRTSSLSGNITFQTSRQVSVGEDDADWQPSSSINVSYLQQRFFGVPNLRFRSTFRAFTDAYFPVLDEPEGLNERENLEWENRLEYSIGKLDLRLISEYSEIEEEGRNLILFQAIRRLGGM